MNVESPWTVYRTRFLVKARRLTAPLVFTDALGREHSGQTGDYLVESSDGLRRITPRQLFEDIYVPLPDTQGLIVPHRGACRDEAPGALISQPRRSISDGNWNAGPRSLEARS